MNKRFLLACLIPALLLEFPVLVYPLLRSLQLSFYTMNLDTQLEPIFSGLDNYSRMLGDGRFWGVLRTTSWFTGLSIALELLIGLTIALVLNHSFRGRGLVRAAAILPWALPTALIAMAWTWIFHDRYGVINGLMTQLGLIEEPLNWLGHPTRAFAAIVVADVWKTSAFMAILLLAGLQSIPEDLYEAHALDGATPWQSFLQITLPLLIPTIGLALMFRGAQAFGIFELVQVMTGGGPAGATETVAPYIHSVALRYLDLGYAACLVVTTFTIVITFVLSYWWMEGRLRSLKDET